MRANPVHPSLIELARTGNFQAIAYWLNQSLIPAGIYASVGASRQGCVGIWVELPPLSSNNWYLPTLQRQVVRFICHQIWKLNSETIDGVRIVARLAGQRRVLWKQSVRIVTPASRQRQGRPMDSKKVPSYPWGEAGDTLMRTIPLVGTAALAFCFGFWMIARDRHVSCKPNCAAEPETSATPTTEVPEVVDTFDWFGENLSVVTPSAIAHPNDPTLAMILSGEVGYPWSEDLATELAQADVTFVNWDNSVESVDRATALRDVGVDLVDVAHEKAMITGEEPLATTLATLETVGLPYVGAGRDQTRAGRPTILEVKGRRIAYFAYATAEGFAARSDRLGLNFSDRARLAEEIQEIRDRVDWVVVNLNWDGKLSETPDPWQIDLAHFVIDAGADLVVGYHSQVLQGAELYRDRPIVYALGSFIFGESSERDFDTAAIKVSLKDDQMKIDLLPVEVRGFQPRIADGERGQAILAAFQERSSAFEYPLPLSTVLSFNADAPDLTVPEATDESEMLSDPIAPEENRENSDNASEAWQYEPPHSDVEVDDESNPFIPDSFIAPPKKSGNNESQWKFPRLQLPFERESVPEHRDAVQGRRAIDLPSFVILRHPSSVLPS